MFVKIENLRVHYKTFGSGKPLLLIHGWGGSINYFGKLTNHLAQKFKVYVLDLPGFGLSTEPEEPWGTSDYAEFIKKFMNEVGVVDPILFGHSFGGKIAINLVGGKLIRAEKIVLIDSSGVRLPKSFVVRLRIYFFKLLKFLSSLPILKSFVASRLDVYKKRIGSRDYRNASGVMRKILVKTVNDSIVPLLPKIDIPVLLLWGEKDCDTPVKAGEIMHDAIKGSQFKIIPDSGHFPFLDNWDQTSLEIDRFL